VFGELWLPIGKRTDSMPYYWQLAQLQSLYMVAATCFNLNQQPFNGVVPAAGKAYRYYP